MLLFYFVFHYSLQGVFIIWLFIPSTLLLLLLSWSLSYGVFYPFVCYFYGFCFPLLHTSLRGCVDISCCAVNSVCTTVVCSCRYIGDFFVAPNLFFSDMLLYPVPPRIYAHCPAVLASLPHFPTGYGPRWKPIRGDLGKRKWQGLESNQRPLTIYAGALNHWATESIR